VGLPQKGGERQEHDHRQVGDRNPRGDAWQRRPGGPPARECDRRHELVDTPMLDSIFCMTLFVGSKNFVITSSQPPESTSSIVNWVGLPAFGNALVNADATLETTGR